MNKDTGEVTSPPSETDSDGSRTASKKVKKAKNAENCARCGKPLGSSVYLTTDGPSCYSCYDEDEPEYLGVVQDWEFQPASKTDDVLPCVIITLSNGDQTDITVTDRDQAGEIAPRMVGQECWDHGDEWRFEPRNGGDADGE